MHRNPLIKTLRSFSRKQMTRFREFAYSPYFNKHEKVRQLVQILDAAYPKFKTETLDRNTLYRQIFGADEFDYKRLSIIFTYTIKLAEDFITIEQSRAEENRNNLLFIRYLRDEKDLIELEKKLRKAEKRAQQFPERDADFHYWQYQLVGERDSLQVLQNQHQQQDLLSQKQRQLDYFYLAEKLRDACEMQVRRSIIQTNYKTRLLDAVLKEVGENQADYANVPIVTVYYQLYHLLTAGAADYFTVVKQTLQQTESFFPIAELRTIYNYLQNFCIAQINRGTAGFLQELFEIYHHQLEKELLTENGLLSEWHYKNIVTVGLRLRELDWTGQFIEQYRSQLPTESRDNAYYFNLASYHYACANFDQTLGLLHRVEFKEEQYNLGAKALLLRTYYDKGEDELLLSLTQAFRQFLGRNRSLNSQRVLALRNFVRLLRAVAKLRMEIDFTEKEVIQKEIQQLKNDIESTKILINRDWLLARLAELS